MSLISGHLGKLLIVKDMIEKNMSYQAILKKTQLKPFQFYKIWNQAKRFGLLELKRIYSRVFGLDLAMKTGKIEAIIALDLLVAEI